MDTRLRPAPIPTAPEPVPVQPTPVVWAPMEPTRYSPEPPPELTRPQVTAQQLALLMAAQQYTLPEPVDTRISGRAKGAALVAVAGGTGVGAAATGVGYAAGMIASASAGLMTAALALAIASGSVIFLTLFFKSAASHRTSGSSGSTYITQNVTATGMFGRAGGTINHR